MLGTLFLGTRGYIEESSQQHLMHSALLLTCAGKRLLLDAGESWAGNLRFLRPDWIAITHAHPDHAFALAEGTRTTVYVSEASYDLLKPAVGFRVTAAGTTLVYNPDVISVVNEAGVLRCVDVYIGDGASLTRPIVRRRGNALFGHTTVRAQLDWCKDYGIRRAYIVHCGKQLVEMPSQTLQRRVDELSGAGLRAIVAHDGMRVRLHANGSKRRSC